MGLSELLNNESVMGEVPVFVKLILNSIVEGTYVKDLGINMNEAVLKLTDIHKVKEKHGEGLSLKINNHEYRYALQDNSKYKTVDDLITAFMKVLSFHKEGKAIKWLQQNAILYFGSKKDKISEVESCILKDVLDSMKISEEEALPKIETFIKENNIDSIEAYEKSSFSNFIRYFK